MLSYPAFAIALPAVSQPSSAQTPNELRTLHASFGAFENELRTEVVGLPSCMLFSQHKAEAQAGFPAHGFTLVHVLGGDLPDRTLQQQFLASFLTDVDSSSTISSDPTGALTRRR